MAQNYFVFLVMLLGFSSSVFALEEVLEEELSGIAAQDGVSVLIGLPNNGWRANEISLTDTNGIDASIMGGYANSGTIAVKGVGFNTCFQTTINGNCSAMAGGIPTIKLDLDMVGDSNGSLSNGRSTLNIGFSLVGGANKVRFFIDEIKLRNGQTGSTEKVLIDFLQNYVDIVPIGSSSLFAMQLGSETLGHMLHFTNGNFGTIDFGTIALVDATTSTNNLRFGLKLDEVDITGSGFDVNDDGLIYTAAAFGANSGGVAAMDITLSDIKMGGASAASIGTIGIQNLKVTNLALTITGKN